MELSSTKNLTAMYTVTTKCPGCGIEEYSWIGTEWVFPGEVSNCASCGTIFYSQNHVIAVDLE